MIAVQVTDENVVDFVSSDFVFRQLHLCTFTAIDQEKLFFIRHDLRGRETLMRRDGGIITQDRNRKTHTLMTISQVRRAVRFPKIAAETFPFPPD